MKLTQERLKELLNYDPETGIFTWRVDRWRSWHMGVLIARAGDVAGSINQAGYRRIKIDYQEHMAHRLAWLYMTGSVPRLVDHRDTDRTNNRWKNLRAATHAMNVQNQRRAHIDSRTGVLGVAPNGCGRFTAMIGCEGKVLYLGTFDTTDEAHKAYVLKKRELHEGCTL